MHYLGTFIYLRSREGNECRLYVPKVNNARTYLKTSGTSLIDFTNQFAETIAVDFLKFRTFSKREFFECLLMQKITKTSFVYFAANLVFGLISVLRLFNTF